MIVFERWNCEMGATKRSQNKCKKCGYTWYPRGKNMSLKCPSCGSNEVGLVGPGIGAIALGVIALAIFSGGKSNSPPTVADTPVEANTVVEQKVETPSPVQSDSAPPAAEQPLANEVKVDESSPAPSVPCESGSEKSGCDLRPEQIKTEQPGETSTTIKPTNEVF